MNAPHHSHADAKMMAIVQASVPFIQFHSPTSNPGGGFHPFTRNGPTGSGDIVGWFFLGIIALPFLALTGAVAFTVAYFILATIAIGILKIINTPRLSIVAATILFTGGAGGHFGLEACHAHTHHAEQSSASGLPIVVTVVLFLSFALLVNGVANLWRMFRNSR
jgi:hypothetical protein